MSMWFRVHFPMDQVASGAVRRLMESLLPIATNIPDLSGIGVFSSELEKSGEVVYFSPAAAIAFAPILAGLPAEECERPSAEKVGLLYGDETKAWKLLGHQFRKA